MCVCCGEVVGQCLLLLTGPVLCAGRQVLMLILLIGSIGGICNCHITLQGFSNSHEHNGVRLGNKSSLCVCDLFPLGTIMSVLRKGWCMHPVPVDGSRHSVWPFSVAVTAFLVAVSAFLVAVSG